MPRLRIEAGLCIRKITVTSTKSDSANKVPTDMAGGWICLGLRKEPLYGLLI